MSTSNETKKRIFLKTSDGEVFAVEEDVAMELGIIKAFLTDEVMISGDIVMPMPNVHSKELTRIIDFCTRHVAMKAKAEKEEAEKAKAEKEEAGKAKAEKEEAGKAKAKKEEAGKAKVEQEEAGKAELMKLYDEFLKDVTPKRALMELHLAADYLNVNGLLELLDQTLDDLINFKKKKSVEYVRNLFGIGGGFTPEEEAALREEYAWAFEGADEDD